MSLDWNSLSLPLFAATTAAAASATAATWLQLHWVRVWHGSHDQGCIQYWGSCAISRSWKCTYRAIYGMRQRLRYTLQLSI